MHELKKRFTIAIVTHNLQQAKRVADKTGFMYVDTTQGGRTGYLVEFGDTEQIFEDPQREAHAGLHPRRVQLNPRAADFIFGDSFRGDSARCEGPCC